MKSQTKTKPNDLSRNKERSRNLMKIKWCHKETKKQKWKKNPNNKEWKRHTWIKEAKRKKQERRAEDYFWKVEEWKKMK